MYCYTVTSTLTTCTCRWADTATHTPGHVINVPSPSLFSPTFMYYTNQRIKETWDMANFCFNLLRFDSVWFMCRRKTRNEEHSVRI